MQVVQEYPYTGDARKPVYIKFLHGGDSSSKVSTEESNVPLVGETSSATTDSISAAAQAQPSTNSAYLLPLQTIRCNTDMLRRAYAEAMSMSSRPNQSRTRSDPADNRVRSDPANIPMRSDQVLPGRRTSRSRNFRTIYLEAEGQASTSTSRASWRPSEEPCHQGGDIPVESLEDRLADTFLWAEENFVKVLGVIMSDLDEIENDIFSTIVKILKNEKRLTTSSKLVFQLESQGHLAPESHVLADFRTFLEEHEAFYVIDKGKDDETEYFVALAGRYQKYTKFVKPKPNEFVSSMTRLKSMAVQLSYLAFNEVKKVWQNDDVRQKFCNLPKSHIDGVLHSVVEMIDRHNCINFEMLLDFFQAILNNAKEPLAEAAGPSNYKELEADENASCCAKKATKGNFKLTKRRRRAWKGREKVIRISYVAEYEKWPLDPEKSGENRKGSVDMDADKNFLESLHSSLGGNSRVMSTRGKVIEPLMMDNSTRERMSYRDDNPNPGPSGSRPCAKKSFDKSIVKVVFEKLYLQTDSSRLNSSPESNFDDVLHSCEIIDDCLVINKDEAKRPWEETMHKIPQSIYSGICKACQDYCAAKVASSVAHFVSLILNYVKRHPFCHLKSIRKEILINNRDKERFLEVCGDLRLETVKDFLGAYFGKSLTENKKRYNVNKNFVDAHQVMLQMDAIYLGLLRCINIFETGIELNFLGNCSMSEIYFEDRKFLRKDIVELDYARFVSKFQTLFFMPGDGMVYPMNDLPQLSDKTSKRLIDALGRHVKKHGPLDCRSLIDVYRDKNELKQCFRNPETDIPKFVSKHSKKFRFEGSKVYITEKRPLLKHWEDLHNNKRANTGRKSKESVNLSLLPIEKKLDSTKRPGASREKVNDNNLNCLPNNSECIKTEGSSLVEAPNVVDSKGNDSLSATSTNKMNSSSKKKFIPENSMSRSNSIDKKNPIPKSSLRERNATSVSKGCTETISVTTNMPSSFMEDIRGILESDRVVPTITTFEGDEIVSTGNPAARVLPAEYEVVEIHVACRKIGELQSKLTDDKTTAAAASTPSGDPIQVQKIHRGKSNKTKQQKLAPSVVKKNASLESQLDVIQFESSEDEDPEVIPEIHTRNNYQLLAIDETEEDLYESNETESTDAEKDVPSNTTDRNKNAAKSEAGSDDSEPDMNAWKTVSNKRQRKDNGTTINKTNRHIAKGSNERSNSYPQERNFWNTNLIANRDPYYPRGSYHYPIPRYREPSGYNTPYLGNSSGYQTYERRPGRQTNKCNRQFMKNYTCSEQCPPIDIRYSDEDFPKLDNEEAICHRQVPSRYSYVNERRSGCSGGNAREHANRDLYHNGKRFGNERVASRDNKGSSIANGYAMESQGSIPRFQADRGQFFSELENDVFESWPTGVHSRSHNENVRFGNLVEQKQEIMKSVPSHETGASSAPNRTQKDDIMESSINYAAANPMIQIHPEGEPQAQISYSDKAFDIVNSRLREKTLKQLKAETNRRPSNRKKKHHDREADSHYRRAIQNCYLHALICQEDKPDFDENVLAYLKNEFHRSRRGNNGSQAKHTEKKEPNPHSGINDQDTSSQVLHQNPNASHCPNYIQSNIPHGATSESEEMPALGIYETDQNNFLPIRTNRRNLSTRAEILESFYRKFGERLSETDALLADNLHGTTRPISVPDTNGQPPANADDVFFQGDHQYDRDFFLCNDLYHQSYEHHHGTGIDGVHAMDFGPTNSSTYFPNGGATWDSATVIAETIREQQLHTRPRTRSSSPISMHHTFWNVEPWEIIDLDSP